jgi:hypothetical protein
LSAVSKRALAWLSEMNDETGIRFAQPVDAADDGDERSRTVRTDEDARRVAQLARQESGSKAYRKLRAEYEESRTNAREAEAARVRAWREHGAPAAVGAAEEFAARARAAGLEVVAEPVDLNTPPDNWPAVPVPLPKPVKMPPRVIVHDLDPKRQDGQVEWKTPTEDEADALQEFFAHGNRRAG